MCAFFEWLDCCHWFSLDAWSSPGLHARNHHSWGQSHPSLLCKQLLPSNCDLPRHNPSTTDAPKGWRRNSFQYEGLPLCLVQKENSAYRTLSYVALQCPHHQHVELLCLQLCNFQPDNWSRPRGQLVSPEAGFERLSAADPTKHGSHLLVALSVERNTPWNWCLQLGPSHALLKCAHLQARHKCHAWRPVV